jgi:Polymerase beta, Nucleotidyltransferase
MTASLNLTPAHRLIVLDILQAHLAARVQIPVFGSRATGRSWRCSDLDLAIDAGRWLTVDGTAIPGDAFDEGDLSDRVSIVDWQAVTPPFRCLIADQRRALDGPRRRRTR